MNKIYIAATPICPEHKGLMRHSLSMSRWECRGFDGEGCEHIVTDEEMEWKYLGKGEVSWGQKE